MLSIFDMSVCGHRPIIISYQGLCALFRMPLPRNACSVRLGGYMLVLYGSLSRTGKGHGTDRAVAAALRGLGT